MGPGTGWLGKAGQPGQYAQGSSVSPSPGLWLQTHVTTPGFLCECWRSNLDPVYAASTFPTKLSPQVPVMAIQLYIIYIIIIIYIIMGSLTISVTKIPSLEIWAMSTPSPKVLKKTK